MALTLVGGVRALGSLETNREDIDYMQGILTLETWNNPITAMTSKYQTYESNTRKVNKYEDKLVPRSDQVNDASNMTDTDTTLTADNPEIWTPGTLGKFMRTGEVFLVTANDGTDATIVREYGVGEGWSSTKAAVVNNDYIEVVGRIYNQGHPMPNIVTTKTTLQYNYCADYRTPFGMSEDVIDSKLRGSDDWGHQEYKKSIEHTMALEMANIDGKPYAGDKALYSSTVSGAMSGGGLDHFLAVAGNADNLIDQDELTMFEFLDACEVLFDKGAPEKYMFVPPNFMYQGLDKWGITKMNTYAGDKMLGMRIGRWEFSAGKTLYFIGHDGIKSPDKGTLYHRCYGLDIGNIYHVIFGRNGATHLRDKIEYENSDGKTYVKQEYQTSQCILPLQMETHIRMRYKTIAAA